MFDFGWNNPYQLQFLFFTNIKLVKMVDIEYFKVLFHCYLKQVDCGKNFKTDIYVWVFISRGRDC